MLKRHLALFLALSVMAACQTYGPPTTSANADAMVGLWCGAGSLGDAENTYREIRKVQNGYEIYTIWQRRDGTPAEQRLSAPTVTALGLEVEIGDPIPNTQLYLNDDGHLVIQAMVMRTRGVRETLYFRQEEKVFPTPCEG